LLITDHRQNRNGVGMGEAKDIAMLDGTGWQACTFSARSDASPCLIEIWKETGTLTAIAASELALP
jgi:hypothetical protein